MQFKVMWSAYRGGAGTVSTTICPSLNEAIAVAARVGGVVFDGAGDRRWPSGIFESLAETDANGASRSEPQATPWGGAEARQLA